MITARQATIKTYKKQAILENADTKKANQIIRQLDKLIKKAINLGKAETEPFNIAEYSDATIKIVKSKLLANCYFFSLSKVNKTIKVYWE